MAQLLITWGSGAACRPPLLLLASSLPFVVFANCHWKANRGLCKHIQLGVSVHRGPGNRFLDNKLPRPTISMPTLFSFCAKIMQYRAQIRSWLRSQSITCLIRIRNRRPSAANSPFESVAVCSGCITFAVGETISQNYTLKRSDRGQLNWQYNLVGGGGGPLERNVAGGWKSVWD